MKGTEKKVEEWTSEKAKAETEAAAGADAEGGAHLAELIGLHHRKLPQQTLVVFAVHLSMLVCLSLSLCFQFLSVTVSVTEKRKSTILC